MNSARHWMLMGDFVIQRLDKSPTDLALEHLMPRIHDVARSEAPWKEWTPESKKAKKPSFSPAPETSPAAEPSASETL